MGIVLMYLVISVAVEISCYNLLVLDNFESFYIIDSNADNNLPPHYINGLLKENETINVFDFHYGKQFIFYSGHNTGGLIRLSFGSRSVTRTRIVQRPVIQDVAVDWVQDKVYWTDRSEMHSVDLDGSNDQLVISPSDFQGLKNILGFELTAIDPYDRKLFFSVAIDDDLGCKALFRSDLQGNNLQELRRHNLNESVIYIKLDPERRKLYAQTIMNKQPYFYAMNYDGTNKFEFHSDYLNLESPFQFYDGKLIFASKEKSQQYTKKTNFYEGTFLSNGSLNVDNHGPWSSGNICVTDIRVYGQEAQLSRDMFFLRKCGDMGCSHKCSVLPVAGAYCICPVEEGLAEDMKSCQWNYTHKITGDGVNIKRIAINDCAYNVQSTKAADYYYTKGYMFYYIPEKKEIYRQLCQSPAVVVRDNVEDVLGLAVDSVNDVIYWVDLPAGLLYKSDTEGNIIYRTELLKCLKSEISNNIVWSSEEYRNNIVVDPHKGYLFVALILKDETYTISRFHLESTERLKTTTGVGIITSISIDVAYETIYYTLLIKETNSMKVTVNQCNYEFEQVETKVVPNDFGKIVSISAFRGKELCIAYNTESGLYREIEYIPQGRMDFAMGKQDEMYMYKMVSAYQQTSAKDWNCLRRHCSHICLDNMTCACPENFRLSRDGSNCVKESEESSPDPEKESEGTSRNPEMPSTQETSVKTKENKEDTQRPEISTRKTTDTNKDHEKNTEEYTEEKKPHNQSSEADAVKETLRVVVIVIITIILVIVAVLICLFPWRDDFEPKSNETLELH